MISKTWIIPKFKQPSSLSLAIRIFAVHYCDWFNVSTDSVLILSRYAVRLLCIIWCWCHRHCIYWKSHIDVRLNARVQEQLMESLVVIEMFYQNCVNNNHLHQITSTNLKIIVYFKILVFILNCLKDNFYLFVQIWALFILLLSR